MKINGRDALKFGGVTIDGAALAVAVVPRGKEGKLVTKSIKAASPKRKGHDPVGGSA